MKSSHLLTFLATSSVASAAWQKLMPGLAVEELFARQWDDAGCSSSSTCAQCFGQGNIICDKIGCFNPDQHEQCCAGAAICVGKTNTCCSALGGPGVTGTAGRPSAAPDTALPAPTSTSTQDSSWTCTRQDSGEACCQRAPVVPLHWCSGDFPAQKCYNAKNQFCCTDGTVCDEEGCCTLFNASTTNPWVKGSSTITHAPTASTVGGGISTTGVTETTTTATKTGAAVVGATPGLLAVGVAALGQMLL
ncbi:uncharacterized protein C8A04DRAFT_32212 [Dichotomopilus funicola]|uniref:Uncharacterized protein n=1 Tax=Dichotomopilus funicola TaxID=1934379 RepID=A0AAN6UWI6_9PEZI|nr:hypothetical protein C8A04DRAFT_32212 [Dichotomopilus funicola]